MKRIKRRRRRLWCWLFVLAGLGYFLVRLAEDGASWAMYRLTPVSTPTVFWTAASSPTGTG